MPQITNLPPNPKLVLLDNAPSQLGKSGLPQEIQFKYQPDEFTMDVGSAWASSTGMNRAQPILQWSHGEQRGYAFGMKLWAVDSTDSIDDQLEALKLSVSKDDTLKRPPRWQFIWGQFIDETVVVKSIGGVKVDKLRNDGTLRGVTLSISLLIYASIDVALVTEDVPTDTYYALTKRSDTWEDMALREYDEPAYGDLLRQANPTVPFPGQEPGTIVLLPKVQNIRQLVLAPSSIPMVRTVAGLALRQAVYSARGVTRQSTIIRS